MDDGGLFCANGRVTSSSSDCRILVSMLIELFIGDFVIYIFFLCIEKSVAEPSKSVCHSFLARVCCTFTLEDDLVLYIILHHNIKFIHFVI